MKLRQSLLAAMSASIVATACAADAEFRIAGAYGFDWLAPQSARCERISEWQAKQFLRCEFHTSGAFGLALPYHACKTQREAEFLIFKSESACQEALETMQANAP